MKKRKMYELIVPADQLPIFWMDEEEKIFRQISDPKTTESLYKDIERHHWSVKDGWVTKERPKPIVWTSRINFILVSVNADELILYIKEQLPAMEERYGDIPGNYIVAHRRVGDVVHVGLTIHDATTEREVHWLD